MQVFLSYCNLFLHYFFSFFHHCAGIEILLFCLIGWRTCLFFWTIVFSGLLSLFLWNCRESIWLWEVNNQGLITACAIFLSRSLLSKKCLLLGSSLVFHLLSSFIFLVLSLDGWMCRRIYYWPTTDNWDDWIVVPAHGSSALSFNSFTVLFYSILISQFLLCACFCITRLFCVGKCRNKLVQSPPTRMPKSRYYWPTNCLDDWIVVLAHGQSTPSMNSFPLFYSISDFLCSLYV